MGRNWIIWAAIHGFMSVACGAFGAHGLRERVEPPDLTIFETGARYQMYHALALLAVAWLAARQGGATIQAAGWFFALGTCVFSGSLYLLVLFNQRWLGAITPIGGVGLLVGWALLGIAAINMGRTSAVLQGGG